MAVWCKWVDLIEDGRGGLEGAGTVRGRQGMASFLEPLEVEPGRFAILVNLPGWLEVSDWHL